MMEKEDQHSKIAYIIYDEYMYFSEGVANHLGLPSIILYTSSAANMMTYQAIPGLLKEGYIPIPDAMMLELVPGLEPLRFKDLLITNFRDLDDLLQLIVKAHDSRPSSAIIWNTMDCLEQSSLAHLWQEYQLPLFPIESFQETVGERGCITKWAPKKQVLAHSAVGGFLSYCGWNSSIESISEGVPMICQPYFGDQRVNSRYLRQVWGVGLEWENDMNRGPIEGAIRMLMVGKEGEVIRQRAKDLKVKIELSTRQAGSSYNSLNELVDQILSF
ncbi:hypothetical protein CerSpe_203050 [Prunus speciosa]